MSTERSDQTLERALQRVEKSEQSSTRNTIIATAIPVALGLIFLAVTYWQVQGLLEHKATLADRVEHLQNNADDLAIQIADKQIELAQLEADVAALTPQAGRGQGRKADKIADQSAAILEAAFAAQDAAKIAGGADQTARRSKLTIKQYIKDLDKEVNLPVVVSSLEKYGFQIDFGTSEIDKKTSAIFFGKDVTSDDARLVALTLMGAGVELKWISRFKKWGGAYSKRIHIGSFPGVTNFEPLTTQAVMEAPDLKMFGNPAHPDHKQTEED